MTWEQRVRAELENTDAQRRRRAVRNYEGAGVEGVYEGRPVVSFASNDYLGLGAHPTVKAAAVDEVNRLGTGAGSARLIAGSRSIHSELERALAQWKGTDAALVFGSGYAANLGVLTAFGGSDVTILSDERNHASIVDGCRLARARTIVYPHLDLDVLERHLSACSPAIVVSDVVFSMDGDRAPTDHLADLCARHDALLVLDEAHDVFAPSSGLGHPDTLRVGTLSKFLGSIGGFVAARRASIEFLVNRARPFIFTTATPPADAAAARAALEVLRSDEGAGRKSRLRSIVDRIAPGHPSPIVPVIVGDDDVALRASEQLLERGLLVPAIRPPSVPPGSARLRITFSAAHTDDHVDRLIDALDGAGLLGRTPAHA